MNNAQYFYRTIVFTRKNNQVSLADIDQPENVTPLDEWLGTVVSLADGSHSILEMIDYMSKKYPAPPSNLEETLHSVIERLVEGNMIKLSDEPVTLPYYLAAPIEELDLDKARKQIQQDGYNLH
ncbi:MAG: hypothetical protein V7752_11795 [Halopseudomonas sp.]